MNKEYKTVFDHPIKKNAMAVFGKDPETMDEFAQSCIDTINDHLANSRENSHVRVVGFAMDIQHSSKVSNSHSSPLLGERHFWSGDGDGDTPRSYPGWTGRVWIRYSEHTRGFGSDNFSPTMTYPGTGGAGAYDGPWTGISHMYYISSIKQKKTFVSPECLSWDYRFFDMDFPGLSGEPLKLYNEEYKVYEKLLEVWRAEMTWYRTTGKNYPLSPVAPVEPKFHMRWTEDEQLAKDEAFEALHLRDAKRRNLNKSYDPA